ncbi:MAG: cell division protein FtsX, partial [Sphingomicrobium sp.]
HRATIEVMHGIGATDEQVARLFQRQIAVDSLLGGLAGAALAGIVLATVMGGAGLATTLAGIPPLGWDDALLLAAFPLFGAGLATLVARRAVLGALRARL